MGDWQQEETIKPTPPSFGNKGGGRVVLDFCGSSNEGVAHKHTHTRVERKKRAPQTSEH